MTNTAPICEEAGCDRKAVARKMCLMHYKRWRRRNPETVYDWQIPIEDRFWANVEKTDGCWLWRGYTVLSGYGRFHIGSRTDGSREQIYAHRYSYESIVGPIPAGAELDHLCRDRRCVNPAHLQPVSRQENILRGRSIAAINAQKTHCPRGHPYDESNTMRTSKGSRMCRQCKQDRARWTPD